MTSTMFLILAILMSANSFSEIPGIMESHDMNTGPGLNDVRQQDTVFHLFSYELGAALGYGATGRGAEVVHELGINESTDSDYLLHGTTIAPLIAFFIARHPFFGPNISFLWADNAFRSEFQMALGIRTGCLFGSESAPVNWYLASSLNYVYVNGAGKFPNHPDYQYSNAYSCTLLETGFKPRIHNAMFLTFGGSITAAGFDGMTMAQYCVFASFSVMDVIR